MSEKSQLIDKLTDNRKTREAYIRSKVSTNVASQLRAVRRREELTQEGLAELSEMKQSRISAMERPGTRWNIETLVRLVAALRVGLVVKVVSFSEMLNWENEFSQDEFNVITIDGDVEFRRERRELPAVAGRAGQMIAIQTAGQRENQYLFELAVGKAQNPRQEQAQPPSAIPLSLLSAPLAGGPREASSGSLG
jgi:transcriptional regulator with XRE-family HTH domain